MSLRRLLTLSALLTALVAAGGCGGGDEDGGTSTAAFCDDVQRIFDANSGDEGQPTDPDAFGKAIDQLQELQPPDEIADDYRTVMDAYDAEQPGDVDQAKVEAAGKRLQPWLEKECKVDG